MAGDSSINITGNVKLASVKRLTDFPLSQIIGDVEVKHGDLNISSGGSPVSVPLSFASGVTETLFLLLYSPKPLIIIVTGKNGDVPGPIRLGLKGFSMFTLTPGNGITVLQAVNPNNDDVTLEYVYASLENASEIADYWK